MKKQEKDEFITSILKITTPCNCDCHSKSMGEIMEIIHMQPCCDRTYEKYLP